MFSPSTPITGTAQTGLTSPTYTITEDTPPSANAKQYAVTALGGTQTGVLAHSISSPFTLTAMKPTTYRKVPAINPSSGQISNVPKNTHTILTRKGVIPLADQASELMLIRSEISIPAGADTADPLSIRAAISAHIGLLSQISSALGDTVITGVL